jgi:hypothetical protein
LNGAARSDVGADGRPSLISGDFAENPGLKATKKTKFLCRRPGGTMNHAKALKKNLSGDDFARNSR